MTKIVTDPFHDIKLYYKAPFYLLRGELIDPMTTRSTDEARPAGPTWRLRRGGAAKTGRRSSRAGCCA